MIVEYNGIVIAHTKDIRNNFVKNVSGKTKFKPKMVTAKIELKIIKFRLSKASDIQDIGIWKIILDRNADPIIKVIW